MSNLEIDRRKTFMLIYAIERGIVDFVKKRNDRIENIESLMFGDVLQMFTQNHSDDQVQALTRQLKNLADLIELATIRNACAHTVRDFFVYYWYRASAFAADPRFQLLGIKEPYEALACAESGQISDPPDEWLEKLTMQEVVNNLPADEQFDKTGLIGRAKEIESTIKEILGGRNNTIALVGPGGVGKTSLAIEIARKLKDPYLFKGKLDGIVYLSFKKEYLTVDGVVKNDAVSSEGLENLFLKEVASLYDLENISFDSLKELLAKDNLLIILDNLEDLLIEDPQSYERFVDDLPSNWKVLVTSRISIDSAKNSPLPGLTDAAIKDLARKYFMATVAKEPNDLTLMKIVNSCSGNPLALKLIVDKYNLGFSIEESTSVAKDQILSYSFKVLINALTSDQKKVLESIFIVDLANKQIIVELTGLSSDSVAEIISKLMKTSLIERLQNESGEGLKISTSVRDLLASNPLSYAYRSEYSVKFNQIMHSQALQRKGLIGLTSFEDKTPASFVNNFKELSRLWVKHYRPNFAHTLDERAQEIITKIDLKLTSEEAEYKRFSDYYRIRGYSRSLMHDQSGAMNYAKKAYEISPDSILSAHLLSNLYLCDRSFDLAEIVLKPFVEDFCIAVSTGKDLTATHELRLLKEVFLTYFKSLSWNNKNQEALDFTSIWMKLPGYLQETFAVSRAASLRRIHESTRHDSQQRQKDLLEAARLIKYCNIELSVVRGPIKSEANKILEEINYTIHRQCVDKLLAEDTNQLKKYLEDFLSSYNESPVQHEVVSVIHQSGEALEHDEIIVEIYSTKPTYAYARDSSGNEYFIPYASFETRSSISLRSGQRILISGYSQNPIIKSSRKANYARLVG